MTLAPTLRPAPLAPADLTRDFLAGLSASTRETYSKGFRAFALWRGSPDPATACAEFLALSAGDANRLASSWRGAMLDAGIAPATAELRMSALRSLVRAGMMAGTHVSPLSLAPMRSARVAKGRRKIGASRQDVDRMLAVATVSERAMLRLLADRGFRAGTVAAFRRGDFDPATGTISATGKGMGGQREARTLAQVTADAVAAHLAETTGEPDDPLFVWDDSAAIRYRVLVIAKRAGVPRFRVHSLRALAITAALDATGGDIRSVQAFANHASPATTIGYDMTRRDLAGEVAKKVMGETAPPG